MQTLTMVPVLSIIFMILSPLIAIAAIIAAIVWLRTRLKQKVSWIYVLAGAIVFIVFAMFLERIVHSMVLRPGSVVLYNSALYVIYGCLMAGIFEETGRFAAFKLLKKKDYGIGAAVSYGIGHGGIEIVILLGLSAISNISLSLMINASSVNQVLDSTPAASRDALKTGIDMLVNTASPIFLVGGIERIFALIIQISLSVIVYLAVTKGRRLWLYPFAILLHAVADIPAALYQRQIIKSVVLCEVLVGSASVGVAVVAVLLYKRWKAEANEQELPMPE